MKRLVLVGGGHAHLSVLRALAQKKTPGVEVTLVTPSTHQNYSGMLPGWMAGHYVQAQCRIDLLSLAQTARVHMAVDRIAGIDADQHCVRLPDGRRLEYDLLSLDIGSEIDLSWLEMAGNKLLPVKPLDDFFVAWPKILACAREQPGYRLVVVGGGAAGVELALAARYAFSRANIQGRVELVVSESGLLAGHAAGVQGRIKHFLARAGVFVHRQRAVGVEEGVMLSDGTLLPADCVIAATGARAPLLLKFSKLMLDENGYIAVNGFHRSLSHPNVFAAGDVCARQDVAMVRSGVHAVRAGPVLAANLLATLMGTPLVTYQPRQRSLYLLACGPQYGVASWGGFSAEGKWIWRWKDRIDRRFIQRFSAP
ncbi:FAD-dependent oxidoreductase [Glaciimonas immobilis]|uniref:Pyridine nucleotide-disulfide oxidoreductase family protein n=1 Tax=Glaciimonas immobilis TaxID=728004 RepID=A0A840RX16_9BURK|nr:FAD-dependent oxidoreductase [Glaciimonas immobilis]KAF3996541.1 FAD-dependent oxidoreductase [Glaciimonas immobilis]MBB5201091.1 pyridine nucleotide-disulfide oxidoreductase family protein [Glaciimonas immobilis]